MHSTTKLTNSLLFVIAVCLGLIVLRLYGVSPAVSSAQAEDVAPGPSVEISNVPLPVRLVGDPIRVQLSWQDPVRGWLPLDVDGGALIVRQ